MFTFLAREAFCRDFLLSVCSLRMSCRVRVKVRVDPIQLVFLATLLPKGRKGRKTGAGRTSLCSWFLSPNAGREEGPLTLPLYAGESLLAFILFVLFRWYF